MDREHHRAGPELARPKPPHQHIRPVGCTADRVRRVRSADRFLSARRLPALHHRPARRLRHPAQAAGPGGRADRGGGGGRRAGGLPLRAQGGPLALQPPRLPPVQDGEHREGARLLRASRPEGHRDGLLRAGRPDLHPDRRGSEPDELPHLPHLQPHRRHDVGRRRHPARLLARPDQLRQQEHRGDPGAGGTGLGGAARHRVPAVEGQGEEGGGRRPRRGRRIPVRLRRGLRRAAGRGGPGRRHRAQKR